MEAIHIQLTGTVVKERYCILEKIGAGGNGSVYLAADMELGQKWAVKVIAPAQKKEALILKELDYPFLPKIIDYEETDEWCYLVMEYIEGDTLETLIQSGKKIEGDILWDIIFKIAEILAYLHRHRKIVVYGDLKPQNLILTDDGSVFLVDFGSAVNSIKEWQNICCGTPGYAAPEQFQGRMTAASDVYAFGKTIHRLLMIRKKGMKNYWKLQILLFWCCRKKEKRRYQNMETVRKCLMRIRPITKKYTDFMKYIRMTGVFILLLMIMICIGGLHGSVEMNRRQEGTKADYKQELTEITDRYWNDDTFQEKGKISKKSCKMAEQELIALLGRFQGKEEQRETLTHLAINAEYRKDYKDAEFYYEQLLAYDPAYLEGYGRYGLFLLRTGKKEKSEDLYESYQEIAKEITVEEDGYYQKICMEQLME